ncbi:amidohydrolase [Mesorhizobium sp. M0848]|uniref:amidohydrolase family protein n=1 Tax=Mesorhizobium sp. M0848 TaxID=2957012 RepID=UPI00333C37F1
MLNLTGDAAGIPSRRVLLQWLGGTASTAILPACASWPLPPGRCVADGRGNIIDVHCHLFNASDVSVEGFVRYVVLGEHREEVFPGLKVAEAGGIVDALVVLLVLILSAGTITAKQEAANLRRGQPMEKPEDMENRQTEAVADALLALDQSQRTANKVVQSIAGDQAVPDYPALLDQIYAEAGIVTAKARGGPLDKAKAVKVARALKGKGSKIARYIDFARLLLGSREAIAREYIRVFADKRCVQMITPSFLDMHRWLGRAPISSITEQVDVMDALQVTIAQSTTGMHMHSMVGFDPRRSAEDHNVLKLVKHAISDCGFVGVKLYPPMGFQPLENGNLKVPKEPKGASGERIERALMELYDWCAAEDVPIMAHAENSLGSVCGYGQRASPKWWRKQLAIPKYSRLRINLAHFGGFDEALDIGDNAPQGLRCEADKYSGPVWEDIIGETIKDDGRDFLFADLSYLSELTIPDSQEEERPEIRRRLEAFRSAYDPDVRHLMYGTDWTMIAKELDNNNYLSNLDAQLRFAGFTASQLQNIYWRNAVRYLGLGHGEKTRGRLQRYCTKRQLPDAWLMAFDAA